MATTAAAAAAAAASARADPPASTSPPPNRATVLAARAAFLGTTATIVAWAMGPLGGVGLAPQRDPETGRVVSTSRLFNWHPVLMGVGVLGFCGEALLAYRSASPLPLAPVLGLLARREAALSGAPPPRGARFAPGRPARKLAHAACHATFMALAALGLAAAWRSHSLAEPPVPQLYSPHSWLGAAAVVMFCGQAAAGSWAYLGSSLPQAERQAFSPLHRRAGLCAFFAALAAMATGVQEKATFSQAFGKADVRGGVVRTAAVIEIGLLLCGLATAMVFFAAPAGGSAGGADGGAGGAAAAAAGAAGGAQDDGDEEGLLPSRAGR